MSTRTCKIASQAKQLYLILVTLSSASQLKQLKMFYSVAVILFLLTNISTIHSQCSININTDLINSGSAKEPLFLKYSGNEYKLMIPEKGVLEFNSAGNTAIIACTSSQKPNFLTYNNKSSSMISCSGGNIFTIDNQRQPVTEFNECHAAITGNIQKLNTKCAQSGILINIGFQLDAGRGFINLINICYNKVTGSVIYATHVIQGKTIKASMLSNSRPVFRTNEVPSKFNITKTYTKANQLKRFTEIFNKDKAQQFLNQTFIARGHLAPDGDFIFTSWQFSTYYYINTMPQWQSINNGNWKHIESDLRTKADKLRKDLNIFTGGFGILSLEGKRILLASDGIEVPQWTWKIAKDSASNSAIAFLTYNNPFASRSPEAFCPDVCNENGWDWKERKTFLKGYTICCKVEDLMTAIPAIPKEAKALRVMRKQ